jgi:hypothetical protein
MPLVLRKSDIERLLYLLELIVVNADNPADVEDAKRIAEIFEAQLIGL